MTLPDAVEDHHLHHRDHPRRDGPELADDAPLRPAGARVDDELEELVGQRLLVDAQPEDARHAPQGTEDRVGEMTMEGNGGALHVRTWEHAKPARVVVLVHGY